MFQLHPQLAADTITLGKLSLCQVLLMNDSQYPWLILVPQRADIEEIYQLNQQDRQQLELESTSIATLLMEHFQGDKFNVAALGNVVSQLHIHHIVRFKNDAAWPKPVWGASPVIPYTNDLLTKKITELQMLLSKQLDFTVY